MRTRTWLLLLLLCLPVFAKEKKTSGQVLDRAALAAVQSYCFETHNLPGNQAYEVRQFIQVESKPRKLLSRIPWKLVPDCRSAPGAAIIAVAFPYLNDIQLGPAGGQANAGNPPPDEGARFKAVLQVTQSGSDLVIYRIETMPLDNPSPDPSGLSAEPSQVQRRDALYNAVRALAGDLKLLSKTAKE